MKKMIVLFMALMTAITCCCCSKKNGLDNDKPPVEENARTGKYIRSVALMDDLQTNYKYLDYSSIARKQDAVLYDFINNSDYVPMDKQTCAPIGYWDDVTKFSKSGRTFGLPSYIGHIDSNGIGTYQPGNQESITVYGNLLAATYAGIDKSNQNGFDLIEMAADDYIGSEGLVLNRSNTMTGQTFWYEIYPQILYSRIAAEYQNHKSYETQLKAGADKWVEALPYFKDENGEVSFQFQSFQFASKKPVYQDSLGRRWIEPSQGAIAYLLYCAYMLETNVSKKNIYLEQMRFCMDNLDDSSINGYYEVVQDYNALMAAIMNFKMGANYDVEKQLNYIFDADSAARPNLGVITGDWGNGYKGNGLMGSNTGVSAYAFAMNTFHLSSVLAPLVKYDTRFAADIGKWFLNASNNAKVFFPNEVSKENQSMGGAFFTDTDGSIPYEGAKHTHKGKTPYAMGDPTELGWGKTDYGIYGGGHVGMFGGIIGKTNIEQILQIDLNKADSFGDKTYPQYLYYNPYGEDKQIILNTVNKSKLFDKFSNTMICENQQGNIAVTIPSKSARVIAVIPQSHQLTKSGNMIFAGKKELSRLSPSVTLRTGNNLQKQIVTGKVKFSVNAQTYSPIKEMRVLINGKQTYLGELLSEFEWDSTLSPNGYYRVEICIKTQDGQKDVSSIVVDALNPIDGAHMVYNPTNKEASETFGGGNAVVTLIDKGMKITESNLSGSYGNAMGPLIEVDFDRNPMIGFTIEDINYGVDIQMIFPDLAKDKHKYILANLVKKGSQSYAINDEIIKYNGQKRLIGKHRVRVNIQPREGEGAYVVVGNFMVYYPSEMPESFKILGLVYGQELNLLEKLTV